MVHHMGLKRFECNICGRKFSQGQCLKEHINSHTSTYLYACDVEGCNEKFKQRSRLSFHKKKLHDIKERSLIETLDLDDQKDLEDLNEGSLYYPSMLS